LENIEEKQLAFLGIILTNAQFLLTDNKHKMNGSGERISTCSTLRNYKLLVDPFLTGKKEPKVYRYDGVFVNEQPTTVIVRDPRKRISTLGKLQADLPVPR